MKFATNHIPQYPPHLRYVTTLPWGMKKSILCRYSADIEENANKFWYFRCLKYGVFLHTDCKWNFPCHCFLLIYYCDQFVAPEIRHSRCHCSVCQQTTIAIWYLATRTKFKKLVFKEIHSKEVDRQISWISRTKHGVNKLLKKLRDTGIVDIATKRNPTTPTFYQRK